MAKLSYVLYKSQIVIFFFGRLGTTNTFATHTLAAKKTRKINTASLRSLIWVFMAVCLTHVHVGWLVIYENPVTNIHQLAYVLRRALPTKRHLCVSVTITS